MSSESVAPWAFAALALILLVTIVVTAGVIGLRIVVRDTSEEARPRIIRATGDYFRALLESPFRWRRK
jgi:succinate dehydrogenase hydrophobic anchor subunit